LPCALPGWALFQRSALSAPWNECIALNNISKTGYSHPNLIKQGPTKCKVGSRERREKRGDQKEESKKKRQVNRSRHAGELVVNPGSEWEVNNARPVNNN
jgi:hypothetical protein